MARPRRTGRPNDYDWELGNGSDLARAATAIVQFEVFLSGTAETWMRVRGDVLWFLDTTGSAVGDILLVGWGLIRGPSGSGDVGVSPLTEGGANWLAYGVATLATEGAIGGAEVNNPTGIAAMRWDVDSKAMRKLRENESVYFISETISINGGPVHNMSFALRALAAR